MSMTRGRDARASAVATVCPTDLPLISFPRRQRPARILEQLFPRESDANDPGCTRGHLFPGPLQGRDTPLARSSLDIALSQEKHPCPRLHALIQVDVW